MSDRTIPPILLQSSPHISSPINTKMMMGTMLLALAPVSLFGVFIFGLKALLNIITAAAAAIAAEFLFRLLIKKPVRVNDLSAGVTGVLLALTLPPTTPLWMTALGAVVAIVVAKEFFGGLGANIFNPALIGRAFLVMSFPTLNTWRLPVLPIPKAFIADVVTGATPLGITKAGAAISEVGASLVQAGLSSSASYWQTIKSLFFGFNAGCIGETSAFLILASFLVLLVTKVIDWRAPVSMIAASFICALIFWQDASIALYHLLTGGLIFGAVFMVTDYVTSPVTPKGKIFFGAGIGVIVMLIRRFGIYPEGVCFSILIMNAAVPFLNKLLPKKYGFVKKAKK